MCTSQTLDKLEARDTKVTKMQRIGFSTLQVTLNGYIRSHVTKVYRVKHLAFYTNWKNLTCVRHEYVGKQLLIWNSAIDCVKAVDESSQPELVDDCNTAKYHDPGLKLWRNTTVNLNQEMRHSQYIRAGRKFVIYCWGNHIDIVAPKLHSSELIDCPTYAFQLNDSFSFSTSDKLVQHKSNGVSVINLETTVLFNVEKIHFHSYNSAHDIINDQINVIDKLLLDLDSASKQINITDINGTPLTWRHLSLASSGGCGFLLFCLICIYINRRCGHHFNLPDLSAWNPRLDVRKEVERQMQATNLKTDLLNVQVQEEVSRQINHNFNSLLANNLAMVGSRPSIAKSQRRRQGRLPISFGNILIEEL